MTSLRGLAAVYVVIFHFKHIGAFNLGAYTPLAWKGYLAVDFFFVLSGFILAYVHAAEFDAGRGDYRKFLGLRLARIYPVHLITLLATAIVLWAGNSRVVDTWLIHSPASFVSNLTLVHSWGLHARTTWNFVAWSVSCEWLAYLMFPAHLFASRPLIARPKAATVVCALSLAVFGWVVIAALNRGAEIRPFDITTDFGVFRVTFEFFAGVVLFRAFDALKNAAHAPWAAIGALSSVLFFAVLQAEWFTSQGMRDVVAIHCLTLLLLAVALDHRPSSLLTRRWLVYLGEISYSLYLVHGVVWVAYIVLFPTVHPTWGRGAATAVVLLAITLVAAVIVFEFLEKPMRRHVRSWMHPRGMQRNTI